MPDPARPALLSRAARQALARGRRGLWLLPLLASALFAAAVLAWAWRADVAEREDRRATLIADALSSEAQLRDRLDGEMEQLRALARRLPGLRHSAAALAAQDEVASGLRRLWLGVTWLDADNRIIASVPEQPSPDVLHAGGPAAGLSAHLSLEAGAEQLVVRYAPALLLRQGIPWWLSRKYEVQLIDASEQVIAGLDQSALRPELGDGETSYMVALGSNMPGAYLELRLRERPPPFWRTVPLVLIAGFLALMLVATLLLRRQMRQVSRAEQAWRTEAGWRQAMEDSALVGLRARDAEGRILYVNRTFCHMVGLEAEALVGRAPPMPYWPPDALPEVMARHQRNLEGHAPREGYEAQWCHQDGRRLDVMVFESPLVDAQGRQIGWMGSIIDITTRRQLEQRERHQAERMAQQSRLTSLGEVASALAHQLNQPLTAIVGYNAGLQRMLGAPGAGTPPAALQALVQQGEQALEAGRIVRRIREFLTRRGPQRERCDLAAVARRAAELLQRDLRGAGVRLEWALQPGLPPVFADPILLEQVLINLLRNAADAIGAAAQPGRGCVRIAAQRAGARFVRLDLEDDGPGLGGRSVEQLCAPFFSTKSEGMGMGLAICRSVIEAHHGGMDAGAGTHLGGARFSFTLPVYEPPAPQADALADEDARAHRAGLDDGAADEPA